MIPTHMSEQTEIGLGILAFLGAQWATWICARYTSYTEIFSWAGIAIGVAFLVGVAPLLVADIIRMHKNIQEINREIRIIDREKERMLLDIERMTLELAELIRKDDRQ